MLQIQFAEIPEEGLAVKVDDVTWFPDREVPRSGEPRAEVFLERRGDRVLLRGTMDVSLLMACDRCLEGFVRPLHVEIRLVLEMAAAGDDDEAPEQAGDSGEFDVVPVEEPVVDLADLLYQQLILGLPQKVLCRPGCLGLCEKCGANLNLEECGCSGDREASPFASLGRLLKDKN